MFGVFNKPKVTLDSLTIELDEWVRVETGETTVKQWANPEQTIALSINFFDEKPDIPTMKNIDELRQYYRENLMQSNGGIIEANFCSLKEVPSIRTIFKIPQKPSGIAYLASYTIPFQAFSFVIKIYAPEITEIGVRNSTIEDLFFEQQAAKKSKYDTWISDPYLKTIRNGTLMNRSEEEEYDVAFPLHPLSQARKLLTDLVDKIQFSRSIERSKLFTK